MEVLGPRRCSATNRAGQPCGRAPIPGGRVCVMHGGAAPAVQQSAKARLLAGADLAIDYLLSMLEPRQPCPACGRSDGDRDPVVLRACQVVLDRSGFGPTASLAVTNAPPEDLSDLTWAQLADRGERLAREARRMADEEAGRSLPDVIATDVAIGVLLPGDGNDEPSIIHADRKSLMGPAHSNE